MMRHTFFGALVVLATSLPGLTQTIRVQTGDHAGFTRLVLPIGTEREWALEQDNEAQWRLSLSPDVDRYDVLGAFDLIQRTRLAGLQPEGDLVMTLACPCAVSAFRHQDRFLVIDISDDAPDNETASSDPVNEPSAQSIDAERLAERAAAARALPDLTSLLTRIETSLFQPRTPMPDIDNALVEPMSEGTSFAGESIPAPNLQLAQAAEIMAEQLARAAAAGLLIPAVDQPFLEQNPDVGGLEAADVSPTQDAETPGEFTTTEEATTAQAVFPSGPLPIRTENSLDPLVQEGLPASFMPEPGSCTGAPLNIRDWGTGVGFDQGLGELREGLYDERDNVVPDAAQDLARHYIFYGFGAEATFWLREDPAAPPELSHIAALLDGATSAAFPTVLIPSDCSDGELFWRYFAQAVEAELPADSIAALQRAFNNLPSGLRDQTGPRFARMLHADGYANAVRNIRDALNRGARLSASELRILDIDLGVAPDSSPEQTRTALAEALRDDGSDPATVMARALAFDRSLGMAPTPDRLTAAEALLRETGSGISADELWQEVLIGHAALGQIDRAIEMLGNPGHGQQVRSAALSTLISERVSVNDTAALLILAYRYGREWQPEGSTARRAQIGAIAALRDAGLFVAADILRTTREPLILPPSSEETIAAPNPLETAWNNRDWASVAEHSYGAHADIAARMVLLEATPAAASEAPVFDLSALDENVADSRVLRAAISSLFEQPSPLLD